MRILHTADWHVGRTIKSRPRLDEHQAVLAEIAEIAAAESADLVLVAGDIFDASTPTPEAEQVVYRGLMDLARTGAEVVVIAGNHDHPKRLEAVAPLLDLVHVRTGSMLRRPDDGGVIELRCRSGEAARIALVPFLSKRQAVRSAELMGGDAIEAHAHYETLCARIIEQMCLDLRSDAVNILMGHLSVLGGKLGGGERLAHTVDEYYIPSTIFPAGLSYVALGHLHAPQRILGGCPIWYSGSPLQLDFGESDTKNSVLLVEASPGVPATVRQRELKSGRRLVTLRGTLDELAPMAPGPEGAYLRLILNQAARVGLADEARELFPGAVQVVLETASKQSGRSTAMETDRSPTDLFKAFLAERQVQDDRLPKLFEELLEEVNAS